MANITSGLSALQELVDGWTDSSPVLFSGFGLSAAAGYPTLQTALVKLVQAAAGSVLNQKSIIAAIQQGETSLLADLIAKRSSSEQIAAILGGMYAEPKELPEAWRSLRLLPFENVITTTWDPLVENAFSQARSDRKPSLVSPTRDQGLAALLKDGEFCIVRLSGTISPPEPLLTFEQFRDTLNHNPVFAKYLTTLIYTKTHLFVGTSAETIIRYLGIAPPSDARTRKAHYAFLQVEDESDIRFELLKSHGVRVISVPGGRRTSELDSWLNRLVVAVHKSRVEGGPAGRPARSRSAYVTGLRLRDIGPFRSLDLSFDKSWNVIVGDNTCGKSTILRALGLGLAGDDPQFAPIGARLLKSGSEQGSIEVCVGSEWTKTSLSGKESVTIHTPAIAPVKSKSVVALGYGAQRGGFTPPSKGPQLRTTGREAGIHDLVPLILGAADPRLFDVKQLIVNAHSRAEPRAGISAEEARANHALIERIFSVIPELLGEDRFTFADVDDTFDVRIRSPDGDISLDQLSHGMSSMIAWVGNLVARLTEIYETIHSDREPFVAVIDEIDAHLHPGWQRALREKLLELFPNGQFIVTTHSPFIVGGSSAAQVVRLERGADGEIARVELGDQDLTGYADNVLRNAAFGLPTTLDAATVAIRNQIRRMRQKLPRTELEEAQLSSLIQELSKRLPVSEATSLSLQALQSVRRAIDRGDLSEDQKAAARTHLTHAEAKVQSTEDDPGGIG